MRAGVVPIVTDIGALGERVTHNVNGFKVPVDEPAAVVNKLRDILHEPRQLPRMRRQIHSGLYRQMDEHLAFLTGHYRRLMSEYRVDPASRPSIASRRGPGRPPADARFTSARIGTFPAGHATRVLRSAICNRWASRRWRGGRDAICAITASERRCAPAVRELFLRQGIRLP